MAAGASTSAKSLRRSRRSCRRTPRDAQLLPRWTLHVDWDLRTWLCLGHHIRPLK